MNVENKEEEGVIKQDYVLYLAVIFTIFIVTLMYVIASRLWCGECCACGMMHKNDLVDTFVSCGDCCSCSGPNSEACHSVGWNMSREECKEND